MAFSAKKQLSEALKVYPVFFILEFMITDKEKDAFDGRIHASGAGGKAIDVALKKSPLPAPRSEFAWDCSAMNLFLDRYSME